MIEIEVIMGDSREISYSFVASLNYVNFIDQLLKISENSVRTLDIQLVSSNFATLFPAYSSFSIV